MRGRETTIVRESDGEHLIGELKTHVLRVMEGIEECRPGAPGVSYREIEHDAGLALDLPAQNGWLTWSVLAVLAEEGRVEAVRYGRRLRWRLTSAAVSL